MCLCVCMRARIIFRLERCIVAALCGYTEDRGCRRACGNSVRADYALEEFNVRAFTFL